MAAVQGGVLESFDGGIVVEGFYGALLLPRAGTVFDEYTESSKCCFGG